MNPSHPACILYVNRETLIWALEIIRATPVHPDGRTEFYAESGRMTLENKDNHGTIGCSQVQIPAEYDRSATSAVFQARYIEEALRQTDATEVTFCFRQPEERDQSMIMELGDNFDYLVMPMR